MVIQDLQTLEAEAAAVAKAAVVQVELEDLVS
jgi:hypothetical protein